MEPPSVEIVPVARSLGRHGALALRLLVSAALLGVVLAYADVGGGACGPRRALGLVRRGPCAHGGRRRPRRTAWRLLLEGVQIEVSAVHAVRAFGASLALILLPTAVAGDAVRTWVVGRQSGRLLGAAAATVGRQGHRTDVPLRTRLGCLRGRQGLLRHRCFCRARVPRRRVGFVRGPQTRSLPVCPERTGTYRPTPLDPLCRGI
jgi:hypothetical protein